MAAGTCEVEGCGRDRQPYCEAHRWRLKVHGDVLAHIPIGHLRNRRAETDEERWLRAVREAFAPAPAEGHGLLWLV